MYRKILTTIDLSEAEMTQKEIVAALEIAKIEKAQLRLVNVQSMMPLAFMDMDYVPVDLVAQLRERVGTELARVWLPMTTDAAAQLCHFSGCADRDRRFGDGRRKESVGAAGRSPGAGRGHRRRSAGGRRDLRSLAAVCPGRRDAGRRGGFRYAGVAVTAV
jgi:hypothetical protein